MNKALLFCTIVLAACGPVTSGQPSDGGEDADASDAFVDASTIDLGPPLLHAVAINGTIHHAVEYGRRPEATVVGYDNRIAAAAVLQGCGEVWVPSVHTEGYSIQNAPMLPEPDPATLTTLCYRHTRDTSAITCGEDLPTCLDHRVGINGLFRIDYIRLPITP